MSQRAAMSQRAVVQRRTAALGIVCLAVWALAGCASTPPEQDPVQIKLNDLDTRLARIERVVANQSLLDLANQIEAMRSDVRSLHNDIDVLNHSLDATRKQQHDLYADLDQRIKVLEAHGATAGALAGAAAAGAAGSTVPAPSADVADKVSYQAAFDLLKDGQYDKAIVAFQSFMATYPNSQLADNAQYWLGEAYYVQKSFPLALAAFEHLAETYPQSRKLPDAMLKIGYCDYELKQFGTARDTLRQLITRFPDTPSAGLAQQRLDKMTNEKL